MALSNIFREPQREITESLVGAVIVIGLIWADYSFGVWFQEYWGYYNFKDSQTKIYYVPWFFGMIAGAMLAIAGVFFLFATHDLGDSICNYLEDRGIHLRPRNRK